MGNSESQYTLPGSKNHSSALNGARQKPCSLKIRSVHAKDEKSSHGWVHGGGGAGYKSRSLARGCLSQLKGNPPYAAARPGGPPCKGPRGLAHSKHRASGPGHELQGHTAALYTENGFQCVSHKPLPDNHTTSRDCNGHLLNCYGRNESVASTPQGQDRRSPRVLIKTLGKLDGCLRVEFHSGATQHGATSPEAEPDPNLPVQLLRYSPTLDADAGRGSSGDSLASQRPSPTDSHLRSSKGSSLSSESSWYDSPWGPVAELSEVEGSPEPSLPTCFPPEDSKKAFSQSCSLSSLRDMCPSAIGLSHEEEGVDASLSHRVSFASDMDVSSRVERGMPGQYSSFTLPCRRSKAFTEDPTKKDTLKARMRRISDWTGSLSRKKRKLQEPRSKEGSDCFDSRSDGLNTDLQPPFQASAPLWSGGSAQVPCQRSESTHAVGSDPLRRNIYENFMRELEMSRATTENVETSTETAESSSESLSSLEQLDVLFEKEQGVIRKAGWLFFKPLVTLQKERKLELVARRKWKQYWVTLKGCTLLFYETYGKNSADQASGPRCALLAEDSIVQSVPEHPKKEHVFCLSNSFGDVYLFQATSQTDLENWVTAIHSACASLFAKKHGKEDTVRLLKSQTKSLLQKIDMDSKMRKMAELQLSVVSDPKNRKAIENQIQQWEQNLEKFHMDLFRMRCYLASLQGGELPNPKSLLAAASRPSKLALGRLGVLSVSSFHALVCSRDDSALRKRTLSLTQRGRSKKGMFSSLKGLDALARKGREKRASVAQIFDSSGSHGFSGAPLPQSSSQSSELRHLEPSHYGLQLRKSVDENIECCIPAPDEYMQKQVYDEIEVFPLNVYDVRLTKTGSVSDFGLRKGNEIVALNGEAVCDLHLKQMEALFAEKSVGLTLVARPPNVRATLGTSWSDSDLFSRDQEGLSPPPNQSQLLEEFLDNMKKNTTNDFSNVPDIPTSLKRSQTDGTLDQVPHREKMEQTFRSAEQIATLCRNFTHAQANGMDGAREGQDAPPRPLARHLSDADRLRKVIQELVDTEKSYVKDLSCLFELYLEPLQSETFLTQDEMESLFGSLPEMLEFQKVFLETLEDGISASCDFNVLETPSQFRKLLFSLGGSFLYYADHFKLYSGFCANHIKVQKVLERAKTDKAFKAFLDARNPTKQHSSTLESYLIKPVQRVLKYPLLLKELVSLTDHESEEHYHLTEALKAMEKVASHINEMQKIYEDYGAVFDQLVAEQSGPEKEVTELSMGELLLHSTVSWLNPFLSLGKVRKELELTVFVFKRAVILVYKENCKLKKKLPSNPRPAHNSAELDPFKFRWLIPISALQVRLGNPAGTENNSIWELIHTKSEIEGRPETVFQLCCSDSESKTSMVKVIRSILRENFRRHIKCELPLEKASKDRRVPLKNRVPVSAKLASSRSLRGLKNSCSSEWPGEPGKGHSLDSDEGSLSSGTTQSSGCPAADGRRDSKGGSPGKGPAGFPDSLIKESDILSDDEDDGCRPPLGGGSPTRDIEIQFQRLSISDEPEAQTGEGEQQSKLVRGHFCPIKRKANSTKRHRSSLVKAQTRHQSLDCQSDNTSLDLNAVLEREFSVQSLTSVVSEECFYQPEGHGKS
ncbi:rho guanine nucleotide exchange factor TIAM2 isoform X2 [Ochotona princeps]|uniref:rho guanine nucleotide exchange factor TIAM2 isoform X2 n=1 Tax=Ochotona princeps TaxID=9978 RepID=UPI0027150C13|nr:rho guanine nucleotide exchange factor TIAM2 isoform X2 [Ochotona princeps]